MLRARAGNRFFFGVDAENIRRLQDDQPISINLASLEGPDVQVIIFYGDTLADCARLLEEASGQPLPPETPTH